MLVILALGKRTEMNWYSLASQPSLPVVSGEWGWCSVSLLETNLLSSHASPHECLPAHTGANTGVLAHTQIQRGLQEMLLLAWNVHTDRQ